MAQEEKEEKFETSNIMYDNATQKCDTCFGTVWRALYVSLHNVETASVFHTNA
jgi:hypothetical protein